MLVDGNFDDDPLYKHFLDENFDIKRITSSVVECAAVSEQLAKLSAGISLLDKILHRQVASHHEDLLSQATEIETLEDILLGVHQKIASLLASAAKLKTKIVEPYEEIRNLTRKLQRLHRVCDLLRRIIRIVRLCKRLRAHVSKEPREIGKANGCLAELTYCLEETDLTGLDIVQTELDYIQWAKRVLEKESEPGLMN